MVEVEGVFLVPTGVILVPTTRRRFVVECSVSSDSSVDACSGRSVLRGGWTDKDSRSSQYINVHKLPPSFGASWLGERDKVTSTSPEMREVGRIHSRVNGFIQDYRDVRARRLRWYAVAHRCCCCRSKSRIKSGRPRGEIRANQDNTGTTSGMSFNRRDSLKKWSTAGFWLLNTRSGTNGGPTFYVLPLRYIPRQWTRMTNACAMVGLRSRSLTGSICCPPDTSRGIQSSTGASCMRHCNVHWTDDSGNDGRIIVLQTTISITFSDTLEGVWYLVICDQVVLLIV